MSKTKIWLSAARLRTLPLSVSGIITGSAAAVGSGAFSVPVFLLALATTLGFQILSNFANDYGDGIKGTDNHERSGPARALQSGLLSASELKKGMAVTAVFTMAIACFLIWEAFKNNSFFFSFLFFVLGVAAVLAAIYYTVGKSAYGYKALGDIFVFAFFGLLGVMGSYFLHVKDLNGFILLPAISVGLLSTAVLNLNNMRDRLSDARANKITLAVLLGERKAKLYHVLLIVLSFLCAVVFFILTSKNWLGFLPLLAFLPLFFHLSKVWKNTAPPLLDPELKKVALCTFLFSVLFFVEKLI